MPATDRFRRISKFELHDLIGEGAMGVVWKAYDTVIRRFVALKLLGPRIGKTSDGRARFLKEARAAGLLQHANLVTLYDFGDADGQLFLAMELVEGRDLSTIIVASEPLGLERKLDMVIELLDGLAYAHDRGVIHRDIKPSNVRVAPDGRVKIMDFGIARLQSADTTGSGTIVGTPNYMAPEQVTNGAITPASDLFSVGCLLYELLSYKKPFEGETVHGVLYQVLTTEPKPLRTMAPSIPAGLERVVRKAMSKAPEDRFQSARQMRDALVGIRSALSGAGDTTVRLRPAWTRVPAPLLRLFRYTPLKWRITALSALAVVAVGLLVAPRTRPVALPPPAIAPPVPSPTPARAPATLGETLAAPPPAGVNPAVLALRDSAIAARTRAAAAGAMKNNVPSVSLAETMLLTAEQRLRSGDRPGASSEYLSAVPEYRKALKEAKALAAEASLELSRATPVVKGMATRSGAVRAATSLARAESLFAEQDYALAALAARDAERTGVAAGIAPPSPQPAAPDSAIGILLADLARAVASERVDNLRQLIPNLSSRDASGWTAFFARATNLEAQYVAHHLRVRGTNASADVEATYRFVPKPAGPQEEGRAPLVMEFRRGPTGWRISSVRAATK
ncbi:MAG TPA: serine/threonine-protein kinase [Gemmatimonadales bacterium]|nr:serine/threonine-protein kinase [Gemmatimonadales bacterium]